MPSVTDKPSLPDYGSPPVIETVLGVQFERVPGFTNAHLGAFWKTLDTDEWPTVIDALPLPPQFERFSEEARWSKGLQVHLSQSSAIRLQIKNRTNDRMIQLQNGRLHFNWLGDSGATYPRYETIRNGFFAVLSGLMVFLQEPPFRDQFRMNQWEVTYINQIPKGTVWDSPADWSFFLPLRSVPTIDSVVDGESFTGEWHFAIPNQRGRLHIAWQHGLDSTAQPDGKEIVRLTLTARGPFSSAFDSKPIDHMTMVANGLDLGRETIVRTFAALMSDAANKHWKLKHAGN